MNDDDISKAVDGLEDSDDYEFIKLAERLRERMKDASDEEKAAIITALVRRLNGKKLERTLASRVPLSVVKSHVR